MKITVAYIKGPRGYKGELAAFLYNPASKSLKNGSTVTLDKDGKTGRYEVEFVKSLKNRIGLKLKGIEDKETAEFWKGAEVYMEKELLEPLADSEYYHFELEGLEVYDDFDQRVGIVERVESGAGNDILNVSGESGDILIPFVKAVVISIDMDKKRIVVKRIEGLF